MAVVKAIKPGSQAAAATEFEAGLVLVSANGTDCRELAFSETVALLRESPRPLTLELVQLDAVGKMDVVETESTVHATFFADKSLGIELASEGDDVCVGRCEAESAAAQAACASRAAAASAAGIGAAPAPA